MVQEFYFWLSFGVLILSITFFVFSNTRTRRIKRLTFVLKKNQNWNSESFDEYAIYKLVDVPLSYILKKYEYEENDPTCPPDETDD